MRTSLLLVPVAILAFGNWVGAQNGPQNPPQNPVPTVTSDLPQVIKPKGAAPAGQKTNEADPSKQEPNGADPRLVDLTAAPEAIPDAPDRRAKSRGVKERPAKETAETTEATGAGGGSAASAGPDYSGPSILSRGMNFVRPSIPTNERFRPFVGVNFYRDSGINGKFQGLGTQNTTNQSFTGGDLSFGLSGQHSRRFDTVQLDYRGHVYLNGYSAQDHSLGLGYSRILNRRLTLTLGESAGMYSNSFSLLNSTIQTDTSVGNIALPVTPNTEASNDKTYFTSAQADVSYQRSARLSFDFGASQFLVKRNSRNLFSVNGYQTRTDMAYRFTKRSTLGPYYAYSRYYYDRTFGDSDIHTIGLNYSLGIRKSIQVRARAGISRLETRGIQPVILASDVALILGVTTGIQRYYSAQYTPDFAIDISKALRHGQFTLSYLRGVSPGNGVVLTSQRNSTSLNYTYSGLRRYAINVGAGRDTLSAVSTTAGSYGGYFGTFSLSRPLPHSVQAVLAYDYRRIGFSSNAYTRNQYRISAGFAFSPNPSPLKFW